MITLCTLHFAFVVVHWSNQLSNFSLIQDFKKVIDFIEVLNSYDGGEQVR
jgi:hypothetical protein